MPSSSTAPEFLRVDTADGGLLSLHVDDPRSRGSLTIEDAAGRLSVRVCADDELQIVIQLLCSARRRSRVGGPLDINISGLLASLDAHAALEPASAQRR